MTHYYGVIISFVIMVVFFMFYNKMTLNYINKIMIGEMSRFGNHYRAKMIELEARIHDLSTESQKELTAMINLNDRILSSKIEELNSKLLECIAIFEERKAKYDSLEVVSLNKEMEGRN